MAMMRDNLSMAGVWSNGAAGEATLEFGRFRVLLRQRQLLADGAPIELGTRAFDLLLVLLEADGSLVTKDELSSRVWPGIVVSEANLKVQICALRRALGEDGDSIRTEFGRGYRFTAAVRSTAPRDIYQRPTQRRCRSSQRAVPQWISGRPRQDEASLPLTGAMLPRNLAVCRYLACGADDRSRGTIAGR